MSIFWPDISAFQAGVSLAGTVACGCKATEGTTYVSSDYARAKAEAARRGVFFYAYHFLHQGSAAAQAAHAYNVVGNATPLMVDFEPTSGSNPTVSDCTAFVDEYRRLGGIVHLVYLPKWYWGQTSLAELRGHADRGTIGRRSQRVAPAPHEVIPLASPSLASLAQRDLCLVSSDYTAYSDSGPGWAAYGGMVPAVWQYTDAFPFNGFDVDFNAFKGSGSADATQTETEFRNLVMTGKLTPAPAQQQEVDVTAATYWGPANEKLAAGIGLDKCAYFTTNLNGEKTAWEKVGTWEFPSGGVSIATSADGHVLLTARGENGQLCYNERSPGPTPVWGGWTNGGGQFIA